MDKKVLLGLLLAVAVVALGCKGKLDAHVDNVDELLEATGDGEMEALFAAGEEAWANRGEAEQVVAAMEAWEAALDAPSGEETDRTAMLADTYTYLAMAHYWYAHGHIRWMELEEREIKRMSKEQYEMGMEAAMNALAIRNSDWNDSMADNNSAADSVQFLTEDDVPAMYWYASNAGRWALLEGMVAALRYKDEIYALMTRVVELNPNYFYNGPDRYFGAYHTKLPLGNPNVELAYEHFTSAIDASPEYLETYVLLAEEWGAKVREREESLEALNYVVNYNLDDAPELRPENENAQRRAQLILDNIDDYFR